MNEKYINNRSKSILRGPSNLQNNKLFLKLKYTIYNNLVHLTRYIYIQ